MNFFGLKELSTRDIWVLKVPNFIVLRVVSPFLANDVCFIKFSALMFGAPILAIVISS
jgi:hypothetical protein